MSARDRVSTAHMAERKKLIKDLGKSVPITNSELQKQFNAAAFLKEKQLNKEKSDQEVLDEKSETEERKETKKKSGGRKLVRKPNFGL